VECPLDRQSEELVFVSMGGALRPIDGIGAGDLHRVTDRRRPTSEEELVVPILAWKGMQRVAVIPEQIMKLR
jgi:hypothetical protein